MGRGKQYVGKHQPAEAQIIMWRARGIKRSEVSTRLKCEVRTSELCFACAEQVIPSMASMCARCLWLLLLARVCCASLDWSAANLTVFLSAAVQHTHSYRETYPSTAHSCVELLPDRAVSDPELLSGNRGL